MRAEFVRDAEAALGAEGIVKELEQLRTYECDGLTGYRVVPGLVALPRSTAGTGLSGGALPVAEGVVISLARESHPRRRPRERARHAPAGRDEPRKAEHVLAAEPDAYASGNPGCLVQVTAALRRAGRPLPAFHPVELLDASLSGIPAGDLLRRARR